jgi:23S rRNA (cytidine1920-2'-O)/16S rRNA (cytidine1409-2'-O)-methyltransferase
MAKKNRLDLELVQRGLFDTREKAQRSIIAGEVWVNGHRAKKASDSCDSTTPIEVKNQERYVSRGGYKLEAALKEFQIDPRGWHCLDIGASTGGFTDCLLQQGAARVTAIDVGHGQLHWKLRQDERVELRERVNARYLTAADFPEPFPLIVIDVSFISLRQILPVAFGLLQLRGRVCALIKPQFEIGKGKVGKGGIVRSETDRQAVVNDLLEWVKSYPVVSEGVISSPILGGEGNHEFLWCISARST